LNTTITAVLFDKDGTLFDFHRSWSSWAARLISDVAGDYGADAADVAECLGYDLTLGRFRAGSLSIAGSVQDQALALAPVLGEADPGVLARRIAGAAVGNVMHPIVPLLPLLDGLASRGLILGVATNDAEVSARAQLTRAGVVDRFAYVAGYDSGHGAKPAPGMCLGFAEAMGLDPATVIMVGDSRHDLDAGRGAGMRTVAVLNGLTPEVELAPLADVVLPHIGHLTGWLDGRGGLPERRS
jgi:phosphoglycolate phosphatase